MKRKIIFGLSGLTDIEYEAALQDLRARQQEGWRLYDETDGVEQDLPAGMFLITDGDFNRRIPWQLSPETTPEFRAAIEELRQLQAEQWEVYDADREMDAGRVVGVICIQHA